jgi:hypothetical protein
MKKTYTLGIKKAINFRTFIDIKVIFDRPRRPAVRRQPANFIIHIAFSLTI